MIPYVRKQTILDSLVGKNVVYFKDLADSLGISVSTVRRDLLAMADEGLVTLLNGGAVTLQQRYSDVPVELKSKTNIAQKEIIARKAAALVEDGDVIYVDSGTTPIMMLKYLTSRRLTLVTSSIAIPRGSLNKDTTLIFLGGELLADLESVVGSITEKQLLSMCFNKAFIGANAYSERGVFTFDLREARKKEIAMQQSERTYLLADTSKRGRNGFAKAFDLKRCTLITEEDEPAEANAAPSDRPES